MMEGRKGEREKKREREREREREMPESQTPIISQSQSFKLNQLEENWLILFTGMRLRELLLRFSSELLNRYMPRIKQTIHLEAFG